MAHKDPVGLISIDLSVRNETLCILLRDDGRGLNLIRLQQKASDMGIFTAADVITPAQIANSILSPV